MCVKDSRICAASESPRQQSESQCQKRPTLVSFGGDGGGCAVGVGPRERMVDWASTTSKTGWCRRAWTRSTSSSSSQGPPRLPAPLALMGAWASSEWGCSVGCLCWARWSIGSARWQPVALTNRHSIYITHSIENTASCAYQPTFNPASTTFTALNNPPPPAFKNGEIGQ
jgi:hypothetical protein